MRQSLSIRSVFRPAAALVLGGLCSNLVIGQTPVVHIMNPAGVAPSDIVPYSITNSTVASNSAGPITSGINPNGIVYTCDATIDATLAGTCSPALSGGCALQTGTNRKAGDCTSIWRGIFRDGRIPEGVHRGCRSLLC